MFDAIFKLLDLAENGILTVGRLNELRAKLAEMQAAGRDPTPEEWAALFDRADAAGADLDAADHRLNQ